MRAEPAATGVARGGTLGQLLLIFFIFIALLAVFAITEEAIGSNRNIARTAVAIPASSSDGRRLFVTTRQQQAATANAAPGARAGTGAGGGAGALACARGYNGGATSALPLNIVFIKTMKTGGSTFGGVLRRVGCVYGFRDVRTGITLDRSTLRWHEKHKLTPGDVWRMEKYEGPGTCMRHAFFGNHMKRRAVQTTILKHRPAAEKLTIIRHPRTRCLSAAYYFNLMPKLKKDPGMDPEAEIFPYVRKDGNCKDWQATYVQKGKSPDDPEAIMASYDFVAVTERMNESLLVIMHTWGLRMADILYLSAKDTSRNAFCEEHGLSDKPDAQSARTQEYLGSATFNKLNRRDIRLHELANQKLDERIAQIPNFAALLEQFNAALAAASSACASTMVTGSREDCVWRDGGCAWACIQSLVDGGEGPFRDVGAPAAPAAVAALGTVRRHDRDDMCSSGR